MCDQEQEQEEPETRHVYLAGGIDTETAGEAIEEINRLSLLDAKEPVHLHLVGCPGGSLIAAMGVVDVIQAAYTAPVHTCAWGAAISAGALILASGAKRKVGRNAIVMVHGMVYELERSSAKDGLSTATAYQRVERDVLLWLDEATGMGGGYWSARVKHQGEVWLTPHEAVADGLADRVIESRR